MGGGAPIAFLNKKPWHPARFSNQEEVRLEKCRLHTVCHQALLHHTAGSALLTFSVPEWGSLVTLQVWKREQQAAAEKKKLEELRKQYEDERKNQELVQLAESAGHLK